MAKNLSLFSFTCYRNSQKPSSLLSYPRPLKCVYIGILIVLFTNPVVFILYSSVHDGYEDCFRCIESSRNSKMKIHFYYYSVYKKRLVFEIQIRYINSIEFIWQELYLSDEFNRVWLIWISKTSLFYTHCSLFHYYNGSFWPGIPGVILFRGNILKNVVERKEFYLFQ